LTVRQWLSTQTYEAIFRGDAKTGNKHARKYGAAVDKLLAHGNAGRDALAVLLKHERMDVRVMAAAHSTTASSPHGSPWRGGITTSLLRCPTCHRASPRRALRSLSGLPVHPSSP